MDYPSCVLCEALEPGHRRKLPGFFRISKRGYEMIGFSALTARPHMPPDLRVAAGCRLRPLLSLLVDKCGQFVPALSAVRLLDRRAGDSGRKQHKSASAGITCCNMFDNGCRWRAGMI
jgi:hypothetical protein